MNASSVACQQPIRDNSIDMTIIGFSVGGFALLTFIIRILTRFTTKTQELFSDDWIMLAAVVRRVPFSCYQVLTMIRWQRVLRPFSLGFSRRMALAVIFGSCSSGR